jgi:fluoride exporter
MQLLFLACAGGAIGAGLRFLVNQAFVRAAASGAGMIDGIPVFPWSTMTVNIAGGFLMGAAFVFIHERLGGAPEWRTFLTTGILGGFTTFSAFSLDMLTLLESGGVLSPRFLFYVLGSVLLAFAALLAGHWLARAVLT